MENNQEIIEIKDKIEDTEIKVEEINKLIVHKPNQSIMITNKNISALQRKTYNVILQRAQKKLKDNPNQLLFQYSMAELKKDAGIKATDNWHLKKDIELLSSIQVQTIKENGDWAHFSLIAQTQIINDMMEIQFPEIIRQSIIENKYYTTLDLIVLKQLDGKYAVILYELVMRYKGISIPEFTVLEFKQLTGTTELYNSDFGMFRKRVIETGIAEINQKCNIVLTFSLKKMNKEITHIQFHVRTKSHEELEREVIEKTKLEQDENLINALYLKLPEIAKDVNSKENISNLLISFSYEHILEEIDYVNLKISEKKEIKSFWAYLSICLKNQYGKKRKAALLQYQKLQEIEKERKDEDKKNMELKIIEIYNNLSQEKIKELQELQSKSRNKVFKLLPFDVFAKMEISKELNS